MRYAPTTESRLRIHLSPEHSAQRRTAPPNRLVAVVVAATQQLLGRKRFRIADHGCGKLRHFEPLRHTATEMFLVDTQRQLDAPHVEGDSVVMIRAIAEKASRKTRTPATVMNDQEFERSRLRLDAVFCVAVLDVLPRATRGRVVGAAHRNLRPGGLLVVVVPRNDSSILRRCRATNRYRDGHIFGRPGSVTFYRNWRDPRPLIREIQHAGFDLRADASRYRHAALIFERDSS